VADFAAPRSFSRGQRPDHLGLSGSRLYAAKLMEIFFRSAEMQDRVKNIPSPAREMADTLFRCDILWKHLQDNDRFCTQIPALTTQRASYSDVEKKMVDYGV
jgi:hypothetical protein